MCVYGSFTDCSIMVLQVMCVWCEGKMEEGTVLHAYTVAASQ